MRSLMNFSVSPCDDFYEFACGSYNSHMRDRIPAWAGEWGFAWDSVDNSTTYAVKDLLEVRLLAAFAFAPPSPHPHNLPPQTDLGVAGRFYRSCLVAEHATVDALTHILDRIQKCKGVPDIFTLIGWLHSMKLVVFFDWDVTVDSQDPSRNLLNLQQGGITLPDPAYYLQPHSIDKVHALQQVAEKVFTLAGVTQPVRSAAEAVAFEALLARGFLSNSKRGIRQVRVSFAAFAHLTQKFDWVSVFAGIGDVDAKWDGMISVDHVKFFEQMSSLVLQQPMQQLRSYMTWRVLKNFAPYMPQPYEDAMQTLDHMLLGTGKNEARWRKCLDISTDNVHPPPPPALPSPSASCLLPPPTSSPPCRCPLCCPLCTTPPSSRRPSSTWPV